MTEEKVEPKLMTFDEFMKLLTNEINRSLNPDGVEKIGFACFVFTKGNVGQGITLSSNCDQDVCHDVAKVYVNKTKKRIK